jgi:hypothetical protein
MLTARRHPRRFSPGLDCLEIRLTLSGDTPSALAILAANPPTISTSDLPVWVDTSCPAPDSPIMARTPSIIIAGAVPTTPA